MHIVSMSILQLILHAAEQIEARFCMSTMSNQSHASSNRVSLISTRLLKIRDQRLAQAIHRMSPKIEKNPRQRLVVISITRGNLARRAGTGWLGRGGFELTNVAFENAL